MSDHAKSEPFKRPTRFVGIDRSVTQFFLVAFVSLIAVSLIVGYKQGAFIPHTSIYFYAADASGINKGMPVKLFGLPVGSVKRLDLSDRGIKVELSIISDYIPRIPRGSDAKISREGVVGGAFLQIIPNTPDKDMPSVAAEEIIEFTPSRTVAELIDDLKLQVTPMLSDVRGVLAALNSKDGDFRKSAAAARVALEQLPATADATRKLMADADRAVVALSPRAEAALTSLAHVSANADQQLPQLAGKMATTLDSLNEAAIQIRDATRKNGEALHDALRQAPAVVRDSGDLVRDGLEIADGVRNAWPVRNLVEPRTTRTLPLDSYESSGSR
jgi:ABC-type transporter Mla subunit MlaD